MHESITRHVLAAFGVVGTWVTWYITHLVEINQVLQNIALITAIVSSIFAARFYANRSHDKK